MKLSAKAPSKRLTPGLSLPNNKVWKMLGAGFLLSGCLLLAGLVTGFWMRPDILTELDNTGISGNNPSLKVVAKNLAKAILQTPKNYAEAVFLAPEIEHLNINLKFKHYNHLLKVREKALQKGQIIHDEESDDYVPAVIDYHNHPIEVKLRLKGDWVDHLKGDKWSFRIQTKGNAEIAGMRRFSIQAPYTRGYQSEMLFLEHLRKEGILAPRYQLVDVTLNGKNIGLMGLEEHFSKELLESQQRKDSVILRLDETLQWASYTLNYAPGVYTNASTAQVRAFSAGQLMKDPVLKSNLETGTGLMRAFLEGKLPASQVFDPVLMGRFLALCEIWDSGHGVLWNNTRFYYNPLSAKIEPIGYDANITTPTNVASLMVPDRDVSIAPQMLQDPLIRHYYIAETERISKAFLNGELINALKNYEKPVLTTLHKEYPWIPPFDFSRIQNRAAVLQNLTAANYETLRKGFPSNNFKYPQLIYANWLDNAQAPCLELVNLIDRPVVIDEIALTGVPQTVAQAIQKQLPITLPATPKNQRPQKQRIPVSRELLSLLLSKIAKIEVNAHVAGQVESEKIPVERYFETIAFNPIPTPTEQEMLTQHPFLSWSKNAHTANIKPGTWSVRGSIILPEGIGLDIPAGTTLRFEKDGELIVRGPVQFNGTATQPIRLDAQDPKLGWQGVAVMNAGQPSNLTYVEIANTTGHNRGNWSLTGATAFYFSPVTLKHCRFENNHAEDAINLIHVKFTLADTVFKNTRSDALDSDFSQGQVLRGRFENIGGDGVDVSGTGVRVTGTEFVNVHDKAVSVGEVSHAIVQGIHVNTAGTGVASKDGSKAEVSQSDFSNIQHIAVMAYQKKPEYGPAMLEAAKLIFQHVRIPTLAQTGSILILDQQPVKTQDIDIDKIYQQGYMKK